MTVQNDLFGKTCVRNERKNPYKKVDALFKQIEFRKSLFLLGSLILL